jgi:hypothetical protein
MLEPNIFVRRRPIDAEGISRWDKKAGLSGQGEKALSNENRKSAWLRPAFSWKATTLKMPISRSMHYERTPCFRKLKLTVVPPADSRWLTSLSKKVDLKNGMFPLGERYALARMTFPPRRQLT